MSESPTTPSAESNPSPQQLQQQVQQLQQQLLTSQRELEAFTYAVSHDLRAPLRSLSGFSQALAELPAAGLDPKAEHYLNRIQQASRKMSEQIDALLSLARISRADMLPRSVDLSALCHDAIAPLRAKYADRTVAIDIEANLQVQADSRLLRTALDALLDNAFKFTAESSEPRISIGRAATAQGNMLFIRDNGIGFDASYADKLFRPFQRLHSDERYAGMGIGLAAAQRVIMRHGGRIWAEPTPQQGTEQGTTIYFTLP